MNTNKLPDFGERCAAWVTASRTVILKWILKWCGRPSQLHCPNSCHSCLLCVETQIPKRHEPFSPSEGFVTHHLNP